MSEMLMQDRHKNESDVYGMGARQLDFGSSSGLPLLPGGHADLDDVGIQDDLAISDSDEDEDDRKPQLNDTPSKNQSDSANINDDDLWF